jgi:ADP-heptose:LPS heptosyltransferase
LIVNLDDRLNDFADTAAVMAQLDLIISVDTAVVHLAGALGREVWTLLPFTSDWRWLADRDDSPWYPSMRLFRQDKPDDWDGIFRKVTAALSEKIKAAAGKAP